MSDHPTSTAISALPDVPGPEDVSEAYAAPSRKQGELYRQLRVVQDKQNVALKAHRSGGRPRFSTDFRAPDVAPNDRIAAWAGDIQTIDAAPAFSLE